MVKTKKNYNTKNKNNFTKKNKLNSSTIIEKLQKDIKLGLPLPQLNHFEKSSNIRNRMSNLKKYKFKLINKSYKLKSNINLPREFFNYRDLKSNKIHPAILLFGPENYLKYDLISDFFQEEARMKCRRYNSDVSPMEYWRDTKNVTAIVNKINSKYGGKINSFTLREALFELTNACSSFRPTVLVSLVKLLGKGKRILDISAGWGDRLIGAIAVNAEYYFAVDPNPDVHKGYDAIRQFFNVNPKRFVIKKEGFEKVKIQMPPTKNGKEVKFDLIMTSPPYFDLEIYTKAQGQSVLGRGKEAWLQEFMFPSLVKAWNALEVNGIMALNINNKREKNVAGYVEEIVEFMNKIDDSDFRGCIGYGDFRRGTKQLRNPQPIWIWRKLPNIEKQQKKFSELLKQDYNPELKIIPEMIPDPMNPNKKIRVNIIRDDLIEAGAKQRAMIPYFQKRPESEFIYMSPFTGSAQITLAFASLYTGKRVTVFMDKREPRHPLTKKALSYGVINLVEIPGGGFKKMEPLVKDYHKWKMLEKGEKYPYLFSLGFKNEEWINILVKQLKAALPAELLHNPPKRIWIPTGSTALINSFYRVFPKSRFPNMHFLVVQAGKTVWDDQVDLTRTTIYRTEEFFYNKAAIQPPYPTTVAYDAKAWAFVLKYALEDDYVMNVTKDPVD